MRRPVTMRLDQDVLTAARRRASGDNRTLTNYVETLLRRDLQIGIDQRLEVIAPPGIRDAVAVPVPGETDAERRRRDDLFFAVLDATGH